jgi:hypothetical protein
MAENTWGGARKGSGRKKLSESGRKPIQISLQQNEVDLLRKLAADNDTNVSRFVVEMINFWQSNH